jgi:hypothetical protein
METTIFLTLKQAPTQLEGLRHSAASCTMHNVAKVSNAGR